MNNMVDQSFGTICFDQTVQLKTFLLRVLVMQVAPPLSQIGLASHQYLFGQMNDDVGKYWVFLTISELFRLRDLLDSLACSANQSAWMTGKYNSDENTLGDCMVLSTKAPIDRFYFDFLPDYIFYIEDLKALEEFVDTIIEYEKSRL